MGYNKFDDEQPAPQTPTGEIVNTTIDNTHKSIITFKVVDYAFKVFLFYSILTTVLSVVVGISVFKLYIQILLDIENAFELRHKLAEDLIYNGVLILLFPILVLVLIVILNKYVGFLDEISDEKISKFKRILAALILIIFVTGLIIIGYNLIRITNTDGEKYNNYISAISFNWIENSEPYNIEGNEIILKLEHKIGCCRWNSKDPNYDLCPRDSDGHLLYSSYCKDVVDYMIKDKKDNGIVTLICGAIYLVIAFICFILSVFL